MSTVASKSSSDERNRRPGLLGRMVAGVRDRISGIGLFVRQIVSELRKVVAPTRNELVTYTVAVFVFVLVIMSYVSLADYGIGKLVLWVFGGDKS